ncbi:Cytochrome P450 monooxygenase yanC [Paramyrothecium foliicola]|nr:Cytochrome P450 monooxygenase yanC [Paramyrothecium foliicola]
MELLASSWLFTGAIAVAVYAVSSVVRFLLSTRRPPNFPPGPPPVLGLGNLHQMVPSDRPFLCFHEWFRTYGDIVGLKMGPKNVVLLANPAHARELFSRRGLKYSGRPQNPVLTDYVVKKPDQSWLSMHDDPKLRQWRAAARHVLSPEATVKAGPAQSALGARLLHDLVQKPDSWSGSLRRWALASPLFSVTGQMLEEFESDFVDRYYTVQHEFMDILEPNNTPPIEIFPFLAYLPSSLAKWKQRAERVSKGIYAVYMRNFDAAKKRYETGHRTAHEPLLTYLMRRREVDDKFSMSDKELSFLAGGLLDGGVDTTFASMGSIMLCLTAHPEVMRRAQAEIDEVCGGKCPGPDDTNKLTYLKACVLEQTNGLDAAQVFRWRGVAQFGLPHLAIEDDVFEGYSIPKGTTIIASAYSMHLRSEDFEQPDKFDPDRYVRNPYGVRWSASQVDQQQQDEGRKATYTFGIGRRVCPGEDFARAMVTMMTAKLLWAFDFRTAGAPDLSWETGYKPGLSNPPQNFEPTVTLRSTARAEEIVAEFGRSEAYLASSRLAMSRE